MYSDLLSKKDPKTQIGVRVNSVSSGLLGEDLPIFDKIIPEAVLLPKVESALEAEQFLEMCSTLKNIENTPLVIFYRICHWFTQYERKFGSVQKNITF